MARGRARGGLGGCFEVDAEAPVIKPPGGAWRTAVTAGDLAVGLGARWYLAQEELPEGV